MDDKNLFFSEVLDLKKSFPILNRFLIKKNGDVTITPSDEDAPEKLVSELSDVFNYFVDFSSYNLGGDMAVKRAQESIKPIFDLLEDLPENLGILNHILNGAMTNRIPTGIPGFDSMIQGGLPRGKAVLIQAPSGSEKNFFISHFIRNCLEHKSNLIMILSQISPKIFKMQLKTLGVDTDRFEKEERIKIIDWYSWRKNDNNSPIPADDSIIYAGIEFSDLMHAFENSMNGLKYTPTKCAVINIITPALKTYEFDQVQDFGKKLIEKLKKNNITSLFIIEKESHKKEEIAKLRTLFDGVIDIENEESDGKSNSKIRILFMHDTEFESEYRLLVLDGTKLNVSPA
jgi:circadian clock protein KaiC